MVFLKPCIINKKFADVYGFDNRNSLVYEENNDLYESMAKAVRIDVKEYSRIQQNLKEMRENIESHSVTDMKEVLHGKN